MRPPAAWTPPHCRVDPRSRVRFLEPIGLLHGRAAAEAIASGLALPLAGGPGAFTVARLMASGMAKMLVPVTAIPADWQVEIQRITAAPPAWAGLPAGKPLIMGILNITPDSFSDGGAHFDTRAAIEAGHAMVQAGAAILDVGGESTRPGAAAVWEGDEIKRVIPAIERLAAMGAAISVDTRRTAVMEAALDAGAQVINDVSALRHDPRSLEFAAGSGAPVVLMHAPGEGEDLHGGGDYADVVLDVFDWLRARRDAAIAAGIGRERIVLDPGIGFGKSVADNLALINGLALFHALGQPLLLGVSRKRMIGALSGEAPAHQRLGGSLTLALRGVDAGVQLLRVHDVPETIQAVRVWRGMRDAALTDFGQLPPG